MSKIYLQKSHSKPEQEVRDMVAELAGDLGQKFDIRLSWEGDHTVNISHSHLKGQLKMSPGLVTIDVKLGLLARAFKGKIESELRSAMEQHLS